MNILFKWSLGTILSSNFIIVLLLLILIFFLILIKMFISFIEKFLLSLIVILIFFVCEWTFIFLFSIISIVILLIVLILLIILILVLLSILIRREVTRSLIKRYYLAQKIIVFPPLFFISYNGPSIADLLEFFGIIFIQIRMVLFSQRIIIFFNLTNRCGLCYSQNLV